MITMGFLSPGLCGGSISLSFSRKCEQSSLLVLPAVWKYTYPGIHVPRAPMRVMELPL